MRTKRPDIALLTVAFLVFASCAAAAHSQENADKPTLRTLSVDWYESSREGVRLQYRDFENEPHILYLPARFERKHFRFVEAPKNFANMSGLPLLLVHMKGQETLFVDIYTEYLRKTARIANFTQQDLDNFKAAEQKGKIEIAF